LDDLLVVGGGIVGAAIALHAALRGMAVRVLDRGEPGGGSTVRSVGLVDVLAPCPPPYLRARREAVAETAAWLERDGRAARVGWAVPGSLHPGLGPEAVAVLTAGGVRAEWWDPERLAAEEPALRLGSGAVHLPDDACLDPSAYLALVRAEARRAGVHWEEAEADRLRPGGGGWTVGPRTARRVVVAAGVWSCRLLPGLPVAPVRGTVLETDPLPPLLRRYTPELRQLADGRVWVGGSYERAGWSLQPDPRVVARLRTRAGQLLPALADAGLRRVWTGLRPMPADGLPLAGNWPGAEGLYVCVTHSGVTMALWLGRRMAALVAGERVPDLDAFHPGRRAGRRSVPWALWPWPPRRSP
jgi:glycine/D-amino acid oxidase-like deaminating enzyme